MNFLVVREFFPAFETDALVEDDPSPAQRMEGEEKGASRSPQRLRAR